jgi:hypothetical protein
MHEFLLSIEQFSFSTWVRESGSIWSFATILFLHAIGLGMIAGVSAIIDLRLLGIAPGVPIKPLERLYPLMKAGFVLSLLTGAALWMADATVKATNPVFWIKLVLVLVGTLVLLRMRTKVFAHPNLEQGPPPGAKAMAWVSLACWLAAIILGRLLGYTGQVAGLAAGL